MHNIIMLGAQGSGKGTQAELLAARLGIPAISTGNLFRAEIEKNTGLGREIKKYVDSGDLVPPEIVDQAISERVNEGDAEHGFVLDGFPRSVEQADALQVILQRENRHLTDVVFINISDAEAMRRLSGRRVCSNMKCEAVYHLEFNPPLKRANHCDRCGEVLEQREDDTPEKIQHRLDLYHTETAPLINYYREIGLLREINGERTITEVEEAIVMALGV
ncbi:MAG: adenylate kinase [Patescibacteria group bacterium]